MCEVCGCEDAREPRVTSSGLHEHGRGHEHEHEHEHEVNPVHRVSPDTPRRVSTRRLDSDVLAVNNRIAQDNRAFFDKRGLYAVNIMSSPGSGKTTIVEYLARRFGDAMAVIVGDIQTRRDAERAIRAGCRAVQIETNGACHLDAHSVAHAIEDLDLHGCKLLVIENVGNLVCPSSYDLGEHEKIAILSLPEGDDKVLKYPSLFHRAGVLLINKIDLAPYVDFAVDKAVNECRSLNRQIVHFSVSAKTGEGMNAFCDYLAKKAGIGAA